MPPSPCSISPALAQRCVVLLLGFLTALVWLYPYTKGPSTTWIVNIIAGISLGAIAVAMAAFRLTWERAFHGLVWGWLMAALLNAGIVFLQYFLVQLPELPLSMHQWIIQNVPAQKFNNLSQDARIFGHLRQRNHMATFLAIGLCCAIYLWYSAAQAKSRLAAWPLLTAGLALSAAVAATSSRIGLLELATVAMGLWFLRKALRPSLPLMACMVVGVLLGALLMPWVLHTWVQPGTGLALGGGLSRMAEVTSCDSRGLMWRHVLEMIAQKPWTGWGWERLAYSYYIADVQWSPPDQPGLRLCAMVDNAHNLFLHFAVELGLPLTLAAFAALAWWVLRQKPWSETAPQRVLAWSLLALVMAHSMVEYPLWHGHFLMLSFVCVLRLSLARGTEAAPQRENTRAGLAVAGLLLVAGFNYLQFDYHRVSQPYLQPIERDSKYADNFLAEADKTLLFKQHSRFAMTLHKPLTPENAPWIVDMAQRQIRYSPDPKVIRRLIDAADMAGQADVAKEHRRLYERAFPAHYKAWLNEKAASSPAAMSFSVVIR